MISIFDVARQAPVFRDVPWEQIAGLITHASLRQLPRGASVFIQAEAAHSLFVVIEGWVKVYRMNTSGNKAVVGIHTTSGNFGEEAAVRGSTYVAGAETATEARVLQVDGADLWQAMKNDAVLCRSLLMGSLHRNRALIHQVEQLKSRTGAQRIADFLLSLCKEEIGECTVMLPYDKVLIAGWLGMKPESLSRAFRRLKPYGVTIRKNHAVIASVAQLARFADEDPSTAWSAQA